MLDRDYLSSEKRILVCSVPSLSGPSRILTHSSLRDKLFYRQFVLLHQEVRQFLASLIYIQLDMNPIQDHFLLNIPKMYCKKERYGSQLIKSKQLILMSSQQFPSMFLKSLSLPPQFLQAYSTSIETFTQTVHPFEQALLSEEKKQAIKTTELEKRKRELQIRIQSLSTRSHQQEEQMEANSYKITDLENTVSQLEMALNDNFGISEVLRIGCKEMEGELNQASEKLKKAEEHKKQVLGMLEDKKNQFNMLLEGYMRDKNIIAEKLNFMNDLETSLIERQRRVKQQELYLKKQWQQLQAKKTQKKTRPKIFKPQSDPQIPTASKPGKSEIPKTQQKQDQILRTPKKKLIKHHNSEIHEISSWANMIASCSKDGFIKVYNVSTLELVSAIKLETDNQVLSVGLYGKRVIAGGSDHSVLLYDVNQAQLVHQFRDHYMKVNAVSWFQNGGFVSGSEDKCVKIWSVDQLTTSYSASTGRPIKCLACRPNQSQIYTGHSDGSVRLYVPSQPSAVSQIKGIIDRPINSIFPMSNPTQILVCSQEGSPIHLLDLKMNKSICKYEGQDYCYSSGKSIATAHEKYIIGGNCDGNIYYWNRQTMKFDRKVGGHDYGVMAMTRVENGLATGDTQGNLILWTV